MRAPVLLVSFVLGFTVLASEIPISEPDIIPISNVRVFSPDVAAGDGFVVAWSEHSPLFSYIATVKVRIYDDDGAPRHLLPLTIGVAGQSFTPRAFWNGGEYVVLHGTPVPKFGGANERPVIFCTRVRADGTLVEDSQ